MDQFDFNMSVADIDVAMMEKRYAEMDNADYQLASYGSWDSSRQYDF